MKKRILISSMLCASLLYSGAFAAGQAEPVSAAEPAPASPVSAAEPAPEAIPYSIGVRAVVTQVVNEDGNISIEVKPDDGEAIILLVSDATILLDNQNAVPVGIGDIKAGDTIYAYHSIMMTMSLPGQTPALAILTNLGESVPAKLHVPEQVRLEGGTAEALCDNGSIYVRIAEDTVFTPYMTRQMVTAADIRMGQPFLAWYDVVMESYPAQAIASRVMILPQEQEEKDLGLVIDGDMVIDAKMIDGTAVVPARLTAETLGLQVGYRREGGTAYVTITDGSKELQMTLGEDQYSCRTAEGATAPLAYGAAPFTAPYMDGVPVTWMSAEAFQMLGYQVSMNHETLTIRK